MKTGVTACVIVYNEEYWLAKTLPPIVQWADRVVIVDGGPFGPSTDGTEAIVANHMESWVTYIRGTFGREGSEDNWDQVMRNEYLDYIETSHMLLIDADEAYLPRDWGNLRQYAEMGVEAVTYPYVHFYVDCRHRLRGGIWEARCHHFTRYDSLCGLDHHLAAAGWHAGSRGCDLRPRHYAISLQPGKPA